MDAAIEVAPSESLSRLTARRILADVMRYRRVPGAHDTCGDRGCEKCSSWHLPKIAAAVTAERPVSFVLPAFPGKSPNPEKVLGTLPDFAERLSLRFLGELAATVKRYYAPGIKIILCSDGRVFSDVVGMKESDVTAYQIELDRMIEEMELADVSTFNLDDHYRGLDFVAMRDALMQRYGSPLASLRNKVREGAKATATAEEQEANRMYRGITRFMYEDSLFPGQTKTKSGLQTEARAKAYEVIRRSNAWTELIAEFFPSSVRLSIHPQSCDSKKLGIRLVGDESWMTPWHGVAVETRDGYVLLKRSEAEASGAELVRDAGGRPSHYRLVGEARLAQRRV